MFFFETITLEKNPFLIYLKEKRNQFELIKEDLKLVAQRYQKNNGLLSDNTDLIFAVHFSFNIVEK